MALRVQSARQPLDRFAGQEVEPTAEATPARQKQTRLNSDQVDELVASYLNGASHRALAEHFDVNETTVRAHLTRRGIAKRPFRKLHGELLDRAVELYAAGSSLRSVATELGVSKETVRSGLVAGGVELR